MIEAHRTDLFEAVKAGDQRKARELIDAEPELVNCKTEQHLPVVLLALYHGQDEIARLLVDAGAELDIFCAAALGKVTRVAQLLNHEPDLVNTFAVDGFTPLGLAAFFGRQTVTRTLLSRGADVRLASRNGLQVQPINSAAASRHLVLVEMLLEAGADANAVSAGGFTPLHAAAQNGQLEMAQLLLRRGALRDAKTEDGKTPLELALAGGHAALVNLLR